MAVQFWLAEVTPTWTDKEVMFAIGGALGTVISVALFLGKLWYSYCARRVKKLQQVLRDKLGSSGDGSDSSSRSAELAAMEQQLGSAQAQLERLNSEHTATKGQASSYEQVANELKNNLTQLGEKLAQHESDLAAIRRRIERAIKIDGQIWVEPVRSNAVEFDPLDRQGRTTPIISVLNLKGGVGKTTVTANLACSLNAMGYRVLLIDLDLQGSLTGLFLSEDEQSALFKQKRLLDDFINSSFDAEFPNLLDYVQPILGEHNRSSLVPTTDTLAYGELNLTIRWVLREGRKDPRFLLRRELQLKRITNAYDIVLLDCPPLINVSCVNALVASDYVIVPVMPSKQSTERVPILLRRLREFRDNINSDLKVLGIVANRTHNRQGLTADESNRLSLLDDQCRDIWGDTIRRFQTFIPQSADIRTAEDEHRTLAPASSTTEVFDRLAREVAKSLPRYCCPRGGTPLQIAEAL